MSGEVGGAGSERRTGCKYFGHLITEKVSGLPKSRSSNLLDAWSAAKTTVPHDLLKSWAWLTAEELCDEIVDCPYSTPKFTATGIACLDTNSVKSAGLLFDKLRFVSEETCVERNKRLTPQKDDVVFAPEGSVGETVIVPAEFRCCLGQRVMLFRPGRVVSPEWFKPAISEPSSLLQLMALDKCIGARHVNLNDMQLSLQPLPPLAEQHRIIANVNTLMDICDKLEAATTTADNTQAQLLEVLLHDLLALDAKNREAG